MLFARETYFMGRIVIVQFQMLFAPTEAVVSRKRLDYTLYVPRRKCFRDQLLYMKLALLTVEKRSFLRERDVSFVQVKIKLLP